MKEKLIANGKKWMYWFLFAVAVITVYKVIDNLENIKIFILNFLGIIAPFLAGILIAYLLYIPAKKIERIFKKVKYKWVQKISRKLSVFITYVIAILIILILINVILPVVIDSIIELTNNFQGYYFSMVERYNMLPEDSILKSQAVQDVVQDVKNINLKDYINTNKLADYAKGVIGIATSIFDVFVAFIVSVYILLERTQILAFVKKLINTIFNKRISNNLGKYFNSTNTIFFRFIASQFIDAIVIGVLTTVAMSLMGIKYAPLLGFMIGLFNMIPYFGAIIAVTISILITIITGGLSQAIWMAIVVIVLQQIDANIVNPKIVGNSLKISPLLVIFAVTVGGAYFGVLGMFLAVPIAAALKILVIDYLDYKNRNKLKIES